MATKPKDLDLGKGYRYGWHDTSTSINEPKRGLTREVVEEISRSKNEPAWMTKFRVKSYEHFLRRPMPNFGADLSEIDFDNIYYYIKPLAEQVKSWDDLPDDIKNTYVKLGIPEAEREMLGGVTAQYECLRGSTKVWTSNGMRRIKEVEPGDYVFALNEETKELEPALVMGSASSGEKEVFEIKARGRTIGASANHPFLVLRDERKPGRTRARFAARWIPVEELRVGDLVAVAADVPDFGHTAELLLPTRPDGGHFPQETTDDLCWWTGFFLGDGYIHQGQYPTIGVAVDARDEELIAELIRVTKDLFEVELTVGKDGWRLTGPGTAPIADFLDLNGLAGTSHTKRVPDWVYTLPRSQRLSFLAGFIDADGYVRDHAANKDIVLTSANEQLLDDLRHLAHLCGITSSRVVTFTGKHPLEPERIMTGYRLFLSGRFDRVPCRNPKRTARLGKRAYIHRQNSVNGTTIRSHTSDYLGFVRIDSIESVGTEMTYDIEVMGHHNFVAEGFIVHNSEVVYHSVRKDLEDQGIFFSDMDTALREHPDLVRKYFGTVIPPNDNKFAALNSAVWSGGSFIYVPPGVKVNIPLQAYFRINKENMGQFERTLIIVDEGADVHYVEGCSAPIYTTDSLHSAVVEIIVHKNAHCRYTTIQNWSNNVYNLVTKRTVVHEGGLMEWVDGNIGCLAEGSTVTTPAGVKPIEDLTAGEEVLSFDHDGGELVWRRVVAKKYSGEQQVRQVRIGERKINVTDNHPFFSFDYDPDAPKKLGRYALAYVRADHLSRAIVPATSIDYGAPWKITMPELTREFTGSNQYADELAMTRTRPSRVTPYEETTDDLMWLFGAFLGDGSIDRKLAKDGGTRWAKVTFSVPREDRARERLTAVMDDVMEGVQPHDRADGVAVTWNSVELADFFEENGFVTGALAKRLPAWVLSLPESQRLELIAGYLDTDGCAPAGRRGFSIKSVNADLLADVARVLTSLGITSRLYTEFDEPREVQILDYVATARGAHRLEFACDERLVARVSPLLAAAAEAQAPVSRPHFRKVGRSGIELPQTVEIRDVEVGEPGAVVPTWDIEVEGTGNFVSEGFIVHNSKVTMKYPSIYLMGEGARGDVLSVAFAGEGQHQDAGGKIVHVAPNTTGQIISKSVSAYGGRTGYRGLVKVEPEASNCKDFVRCDALILDADSRSDTYPYMDIANQTAEIGHEATVSKVGDDQLFYLMSRGISENEAMGMIVNGFIEPITKELPMEYAVELTRLIQLQMEGAVG
jgi:Fe-S cluster assembly scaffold protein SufB